MMRIYFTCIFFLSLSVSGFCQLTKVNLKIIDNLPSKGSGGFFKKSITNPKTCGRDTVEYPRYKATNFNAITIKKNYSLGQFYGAPQDITVHGFTFYAWVANNPPVDKIVRVICNMYKAGTDSLPSGAPLASDTVDLDSVFGGGVLTKLEKKANFDFPVTVNYPYILTVESDSASINAGVVANGWVSKDGKGENYLCGSVSGRWYRGLSLNIAGVNLDADMQFYPHVSYKFGTDFTIPDCFDFKDSVRLKNAYRSNVSGSKFYNYYSYYKLDLYSHLWNYGEQFWNQYDDNGVYKYSGKGNFKVRLISSVYYWQSGTCTDTVEKMLYFRPKEPVAVSKTDICIGEKAIITVASDTGTIIKWFRNPSSPNPVYTGETVNLGVPAINDTFYVKAFNKASLNCESYFSTIIIRVHDYPQDPKISNDSICQGAKANLEAKSNIGRTEWFTDSTLLPFYFGDVHQTGALSSDLSYYVRSNNFGCYSPSFKKITAFVDNSFAPEDPIVSKDTGICLRPAGKAFLKAFSTSGDSLSWFSVPSGGSKIAAGNNYEFTPVAAGVSTIYVEAHKSICASTRLGINITVSDYPSFSQLYHDEKCKGDTAQVAATLSSPGQIKWFHTPTTGTPIDSGYVIRFYTVLTKKLYAQAEANGCINPARSIVNIKINAYDSITKIDVPLICGGAKATLKITAGSNLIRWYEDEEATKLVSSVAQFTTPFLLTNTNYYFTVEKNGCKSPVNTVFVEVLPLPVSGYDYEFITGHKIRLTPTAGTGVTYKWIMGDGNVFTTRFITHKYEKYGTYNIKLIVTSLTTGCRDSASQDILFDFSGIKPDVEQSIKVFPNPSSGNFTLTLPSDLVTGNLSIMSTEGKLVYRTSLLNNNDLFMEKPFTRGVYIIRVDWDNKSAYGRLIID